MEQIFQLLTQQRFDTFTCPKPEPESGLFCYGGVFRLVFVCSVERQAEQQRGEAAALGAALEKCCYVTVIRELTRAWRLRPLTVPLPLVCIA